MVTVHLSEGSYSKHSRLPLPAFQPSQDGFKASGPGQAGFKAWPIIKLKDGKAPGNDGIVPEFLKSLACEISEPLSMIFNKLISEGFVPQEWKS